MYGMSEILDSSQFPRFMFIFQEVNSRWGWRGRFKTGSELIHGVFPILNGCLYEFLRIKANMKIQDNR
jgi:hypothetical protein